jgi:hypothetical protein
MPETIALQASRNRRHKPHPEIADLSPRERASEAAAIPAAILGGVLGRDVQFMRAVAAVRADVSAVDSIARSYVPKAGRGRDVVARMLAAAGSEPTDALAVARLTNLSPAVVWAGPRHDGDRARWVRGQANHQDAAHRLARRGAGLCLDLECSTSVPGRRLWCSAHEREHHPAERESAERSIRTLLDAVARAVLPARTVAPAVAPNH